MYLNYLESNISSDEQHRHGDDVISALGWRTAVSLTFNPDDIEISKPAWATQGNPVSNNNNNKNNHKKKSCLTSKVSGILWPVIIKIEREYSLHVCTCLCLREQQ